jgi:ribosomal-protein-alanine N-acetyltransferase
MRDGIDQDAGLETRRLTLRKASEDDAAFMLELMNERAYLANIGDRKIRTLTEAAAYIAAKYTASYATLSYGLYVVEIKAEQTPVGICGFVKRAALDHADLGFAFLEKHWRRGYGYESSIAVLEEVRLTLGFSQVYGVTVPQNLGSIRLLEKLGFGYARALCLPGNVGESLLFSKKL